MSSESPILRDLEQLVSPDTPQSVEPPTDLSESQPRNSPEPNTLMKFNKTDDCRTEEDNKSGDIGNDSNNNNRNSGCRNNNVEENNDSPNNSNCNNNSQQFCLRWNNYQSNLTCVFDQLLQSESFVDVTLACDGNSIKAHKMILSACSPYFQSLFYDNPCQHPIIIMRDVKWAELKAAVEFMYKGEINVSQDQIGPLLKIAEMLQIRGLAEVNPEKEKISIPEQIGKPSEHKKIPPKEDSPVDLTDSMDIEEQINLHQEKQKKEQLEKEKEKEKERDRERSHATESKKPKLTPRDWKSMTSPQTMTSPLNKQFRKRRWPSGERSPRSNTPENLDHSSPIPVTPSSLPNSASTPVSPFPIPGPLDSLALQQLSIPPTDEMEIKPGIAEMIREEERVSGF